MEKGYIYKIICLPTGKLYIGQTLRTIEKRWKRHIRDAKKGSDHKFHRAIRKYGEENFIIEEVLTVSASTKDALKKKLDYIEIRLIRNLNTRENGYNTTDGGEGRLGYKMPEVHRKKISEARKGTHLSEETKEKLRRINLGRNFQLRLVRK